MSECEQPAPEHDEMQAGGWRRGLPPGPYYEGMTKDYEAYFSPAGMKWHRPVAISKTTGGES